MAVGKSVVWTVFLCVAVCFGLTPKPLSSLHQLVSDDTKIDARVAELDFTHKWFLNQTDVRSRTPLSCPLPVPNFASFGLGYDSVSNEMESTACWIAATHKSAGNLDVDSFVKSGAQLVQGAGVSELLFASIVTAAKLFQMNGHQGKPFVTMHVTPYYSILKLHCQSHVLASVVEYIEPHNVTAELVAGRPLIVVAITPTNPGGTVEEGLLSQCTLKNDDGTRQCFGSPTRVIADHSFMWPCTVRPQLRNSGAWKWPLGPTNDDALLFGLSKLSGHSGVRFGWAWVRNAEIASVMRATLWEIGLTLSVSSVVHAAHVLASVSEGSFHEWCADKMDSRWLELRSLPMFASHSRCFDIQSEQRSAVVLIECRVHQSCHEFFESRGVLVTRGSQFGVSDSKVRIALGLSEDSLRELMNRLRLVSCPS